MVVSEALKINHKRGFKYSRGMKHRPTKAEMVLAQALRTSGIAFKQQSYFLDEKTLFIPDFRLQCDYYKLVVEVDGPSHLRQEQYDLKRSAWLRLHRNCRVIRFSNEQVISNVDAVIAEIQKHKPKTQHLVDMDRIQSMAWFQTG